MSGFVNGYYQFSLWAMRLAYVNILWFTFTLVGLFFFGLMPATAGMFAVVRKWVAGDTDIKIFQTFWKSYSKEFLKANLLGYLLAGIGYLLYIELQILRAQENMSYFVASYGVIALLIVLLIVLLYSFPIFVHFNISTLQNIKWAFVIGVIHPVLTIAMIAILGVVHYVAFMTIPALLFFFGGSVTAFILTWGASKTFTKYEPSNV